MILRIDKMTIVASVILLLSLIRIGHTTQLPAHDPPVGLVPEHLLFNIKTNAAGEYNEKPLTVIEISPPTALNPTNPTTPLRPGRKYKRVVCPPGFTRAGDVIPGLESGLPVTIHDVGDPAPNFPSEQVTATDTGGTTPNTSPSTSVIQLVPPASQSTPSANPPVPGTPLQPGAPSAASIPPVLQVTETTTGGDNITPQDNPSGLQVTATSTGPGPDPSIHVFPAPRPPPVAPPVSSSASSPASSPSIIIPPPAVLPPVVPVEPSPTPASSLGQDGPASASIITPTSAPSGGHFQHKPLPPSSQGASDSPITTDPIIIVTTPITTPTTTSNSGTVRHQGDVPIVPQVGVSSITPTQGPALSTQTPDGPSSLHDAPKPTPESGQDTTNQNTVTPLPPTTTVTPITTPNDPPSLAQVTVSTTSPDSPTPDFSSGITPPNPPSDLQVAATTADSSQPPPTPRFFIRQAITDPNACIPIPDDEPTAGQTSSLGTSTDGFLASSLQPTPITTQITFTTLESGTLLTGVTIVTTIPGVQEIQPVPVTTQVTLTTSVSGTLQTVVTLVTTTPPPVPIEPPQPVTTQITLTTSESGSLLTVVTLVTTTPSLTNPTTESITYVTLISGTPQTMVTVLTEEGVVKVATATTTPFSAITILLDWPTPTTTSQSGFGGSFSTYREGITFWIGIVCGFIMIGIWF